MQIPICCMSGHIINLPLYEENNTHSYPNKLLHPTAFQNLFKTRCRFLAQTVTTPPPIYNIVNLRGYLCLRNIKLLMYT